MVIKFFGENTQILKKLVWLIQKIVLSFIFKIIGDFKLKTWMNFMSKISYLNFVSPLSEFKEPNREGKGKNYEP